MNKEVEMQDKKDDWVKIVSSDGFSFVLQREVAMGSGHLKGMLDSSHGGFEESLSGIVHVSERGIIVEKLLEYLMYKKLYENSQNPKDVPDFQERIIPEIALELLVAADYYDA
ncbi:POZ domain-containing protein [Fomitiporia mediterranea MF3/22]|uniref:POZ domain-containing protein n=1 Tax=Fomitiporia mediterranea (strain MF3/22) TaxID=694068 RepID=UPI00044099A6|nr:POZ domain-containing protein [Fomitiporia mediterranea MF3/22]EJD08481.1 POZ domain-containing protein [Fomitiporia mediterranea MF3/22]